VTLQFLQMKFVLEIPHPLLHCFYHGALSSGRVTVTDSDCMFLHNYRHVITQQLYQLWKVQSAHSLSLQFVSDVLFVSA
jgi:hypothetical protein